MTSFPTTDKSCDFQADIIQFDHLKQGERILTAWNITVRYCSPPVRYSQAVSHPSTNQARPCLASEIGRVQGGMAVSEDAGDKRTIH